MDIDSTAIMLSLDNECELSMKIDQLLAVLNRLAFREPAVVKAVCEVLLNNEKVTSAAEKYEVPQTHLSTALTRVRKQCENMSIAPPAKKSKDAAQPRLHFESFFLTQEQVNIVKALERCNLEGDLENKVDLIQRHELYQLDVFSSLEDEREADEKEPDEKEPDEKEPDEKEPDEKETDE